MFFSGEYPFVRVLVKKKCWRAARRSRRHDAGGIAGGSWRESLWRGGGAEDSAGELAGRGEPGSAVSLSEDLAVRCERKSVPRGTIRAKSVL
jgi:hypothetical protein